MVHITVDIDAGVKKEFKVLCAQHGDNMSAILKRCVRDYISSKNVHIVKS